jgi:protein phosphatase
MRLRAGARTAVGKVRKHNEDSMACEPGLGLFVVCDGMGGEAAGEVASQLAIKTILETVNGADTSPPPTPSEEHKGFQPRTLRLAAALERSNQAIYEQAQHDVHQTGMGTTAVSAWLENNQASLAHVGDSRAYLWHGGQLEQLTRDHSLVEEQVRAGIITREQSLESDKQNILLRALGKEPAVEVELGERQLQPGDYLLLCSDGLTRMVSERELSDTIGRLRDPQPIADRLVERAVENGGVDNVTAVVVEVGGPSWWQRLFGG